MAFAVLVVVAFAVVDRHNEGYKWLMAMLILWGTAFVAALCAAVFAALSLMRGAPGSRTGGLMLAFSLAAAVFTAPGGLVLAKGLSAWLPALVRCAANTC